jgi:hypothetical protein
MKHLFTLLLAAALVPAAAVAQPLALYENHGTVNDNPQIDAVAFANYGTFSVSSTLPYDFQNTLHFTNIGTMTAFPGFRFANATSLGPAFTSSIDFVNEVGGVVTAGDVILGGIRGGGIADPT